MSQGQLSTLIICVEFRKLDDSELIICVEFLNIYGSDFEGLALDVDFVICKSSSSSTSLILTTWAHLMGSRYPYTALACFGIFESWNSACGEGSIV